MGHVLLPDNSHERLLRDDLLPIVFLVRVLVHSVEDVLTHLGKCLGAKQLLRLRVQPLDALLHILKARRGAPPPANQRPPHVLHTPLPTPIPGLLFVVLWRLFQQVVNLIHEAIHPLNSSSRLPCTNQRRDKVVRLVQVIRLCQVGTVGPGRRRGLAKLLQVSSCGGGGRRCWRCRHRHPVAVRGPLLRHRQMLLRCGGRPLDCIPPVLGIRSDRGSSGRDSGPRSRGLGLQHIHPYSGLLMRRDLGPLPCLPCLHQLPAVFFRPGRRCSLALGLHLCVRRFHFLHLRPGPLDVVGLLPWSRGRAGLVVPRRGGLRVSA
mmetsp:Transcript_30124/g.85029  ORF Transcript_30124/g.85029 Transcript_30124/m.85029 type:complete len:319 (-) Transcript_30124:392-1348(-)